MRAYFTDMVRECRDGDGILYSQGIRERIDLRAGEVAERGAMLFGNKSTPFQPMSNLADIDPATQNAWFLGTLPSGVIFSMCQTVRVIAGDQRGTIGKVISLYSLHPEPLYHVEAGDGSDLIIRQSGLEAYEE